MDFHPHHPLQPFWNLAAAPIQTQALSLALDHGLFELLRQPAAAAAVAERLGLRQAASRAWLDLLWSLGLLERSRADAPHYRTSALAARFFCEDAAETCAQAWQYRARILGACAGQMDDLLRHGSAGEPPAGSWAQAARVQIHQEQRAVSVPALLRLLDDWPALPAQGRFLDLGGGPGHVAIALAERFPAWHGTLCDLPGTVEVAARHIEQAGLAPRIAVHGCDLQRDALPGGYDLIWCSSVLHFLDDPLAALGKMFAALNPGGRLIVAHAEIAADAEQAARVMPFYTPMLMRGHYLPRPGEIARALAALGFAEVRSPGCIAVALAPLWLHTGVRP